MYISPAGLVRVRFRTRNVRQCDDSVTMPLHTRMTRRLWVRLSGGALGAVALGCGSPIAGQSDETGSGRLTARPHQRVTTSLVTGPLGLGDGGRDGVIQ